MIKKLLSSLSIFFLLLIALLVSPPRSFAALGWQQLLPNGNGGPIARASNTNSAWDPAAKRMLLFGGNDSAHGGYLNDLWQYTATNGWQNIIPNSPSGNPSQRTNHGTAWDSQSGRLFVFGGFNNFGQFHNDLWQYTAANGWQLVTADGAIGSPPTRDDTTLEWDTQNNRLLLFGGNGGSVVYNDLWQYTAANGWQVLTPDGDAGAPSRRSSHAGTWDGQNNRLLIFGGTEVVPGAGPLMPLNDLWQYTSTNGWQQLTVDGDPGAIPQRRRATASWDTEQGRLLVFGGYDLNGVKGDFWQYTTVNGWQEIMATGAPEARGDQTTVWDTDKDRLLLFGGYNGSVELNDLWQYKDTEQVPQLTALAPTKIWVGLKNSDDVGIKFDLRAEAYKNTTLVSAGEMSSVPAGSSGFNNAKLNTIAFGNFSPIDFEDGSQLSVKLYVRNACVGSGHNSGTARLWYNDSQANSQFGATVDATSTPYYLLNNFLLGTGPGTTRKTIDVAAGAKCSPFKPFGQWTITP